MAYHCRFLLMQGQGVGNRPPSLSPFCVKHSHTHPFPLHQHQRLICHTRSVHPLILLLCLCLSLQPPCQANPVFVWAAAANPGLLLPLSRHKWPCSISPTIPPHLCPSLFVGARGILLFLRHHHHPQH